MYPVHIIDLINATDDRVHVPAPAKIFSVAGQIDQIRIVDHSHASHYTLRFGAINRPAIIRDAPRRDDCDDHQRGHQLNKREGFFSHIQRISSDLVGNLNTWPW